MVLSVFNKIYILFSLFSLSVYSEEILVIEKKNQIRESFTDSEVIINIDAPKNLGRPIAEILEEIPGIKIIENSGPLNESTFIIRGYKNKHIVFLRDGVPLFNGGGDDSKNLNSLNLSGIGHIKVSKGSHSQSMGGVIDLISRKNSSNELIVERGSTEHEKYQGRLSTIDGRLNLSINFEKNKGDYHFKNPKAVEVYDEGLSDELQMKNNQSEKISVFSSYSSKFFNGKNLFFIEMEEYNRGLPGKISHFYNDVSLKENNYRISNSFQRKNINIKTSASKKQLEFRDDQGEVRGISDRYKEKSQDQYFEFGYYKNWNSYTLTNVKLSAQIENFESRIVKKTRRNEALNLSQSFFINNFIVSPFVVHNRQTEIESFQNFGVVSEWVWKKLLIKAKIGKSQKSPSFDELYKSEGIVVGNPELKPEKNIGGDLSATINFLNNEVVLSYFYYKNDDLIRYILTSGFQYRPFNISQSVNEGLEFSLKSQLTQAIEFYSNLTYQNVLNKDTDPFIYNKRVPGIPQFFGHIGVSSTILKRMRLSVDYNFSNKRYATIDNNQRLPDQKNLNSRINFNFNQSTILYFNVENILSEENYDHFGYPLESRKYRGGFNVKF